jgi:integrase
VASIEPWTGSWTDVGDPVYRHVMARGPAGHMEQLPSGSWRVKVYAGTDPLTGREIRFRKTCKTERAAQIELGKLLAMARAGRQPDSDVTVAQLLDQYVSTAGWDVSTRESNLGYIHRTIKPALGSLQVRKVRGPILDTLYARLMRCGNLACTGKPFTEHRNIPDLQPDPADPRLEWEQAADRVRAAIGSGQLASGDALPSVRDLARLQGLKPGTVRHAFIALAEEGLVHIRHGRTTTIAGEPTADDPGIRRQVTRPRPGHDCQLSGCRPHVCKPMAKSTIRGIHNILSGAFQAAMRWEWTDRNPAASARPPTPSRQTILATSPEAVAKVIAEARACSAALGLYLWLVVVTGVRRGELCGLQIHDVDLDRALVHVAFNYVVRGGQRVRKDTKTHQDRWLAIDPVTCTLIASYLDEIRAELAAVGLGLRDDAYLFSNDPAHSRPWNPDWATHRVAEAAEAAGVELDIKGGRHYTASQLLAGGFDLRNTAARLGHSGGGATTLRHYADPVPEVDRRAAAYLAQLTAGSAPQGG